MDIERFEEIAAEELDLLPKDFFRELHGGVVISEEVKLSDNALENDLYTLGVYKHNSLGNSIILYYGSFTKTAGMLTSEEAWRKKIREVIRHEFRHHLEHLAGVHNSESLEAEDARELAEYKRRHEAIKKE